MTICCKECYPHCDFCIHAKYYYIGQGEKRIKIVEGCKKHLDEHHQSLARGLHYCKDFHCYRAKEENNAT